MPIIKVLPLLLVSFIFCLQPMNERDGQYGWFSRFDQWDRKDPLHVDKRSCWSLSGVNLRSTCGERVTQTIHHSRSPLPGVNLGLTRTDFLAFHYLHSNINNYSVNPILAQRYLPLPPPTLWYAHNQAKRRRSWLFTGEEGVSNRLETFVVA